jgi:hypothetical protein
MKKFIVAIFTISTFMSCAPDNSTISTDIVANPQTASGEEANAKLPDIKFEEELFEDDFDEEKYNEYMDTYEDKYEKK